MKKMLALFLVLALLLCGCGKTASGPDTKDTIWDTVPAGTTADASAAKGEEGTPAFTSPAREETRVFFTCQNYDYDCYPGWCCSSDIRFLFLSREHYDLEDIQVSLLIEAPYRVGIWEEKVPYDRTQYYWEKQYSGYDALISSRKLDTDFPLWIY